MKYYFNFCNVCTTVLFTIPKLEIDKIAYPNSRYDIIQNQPTPMYYYFKTGQPDRYSEIKSNLFDFTFICRHACKNYVLTDVTPFSLFPAIPTNMHEINSKNLKYYDIILCFRPQWMYLLLYSFYVRKAPSLKDHY